MKKHVLRQDGLILSTLLMVCVLVSACGGPAVAPVPTERYFSISLIQMESTVTIQDEDVRHFRRVLENELRERFAIGNNSELNIAYRFITRDDATMIETVFTNRAGELLDTTYTSATVEGVLFGIGGSLQGTLENAAEEIAEFTIERFAE